MAFPGTEAAIADAEARLRRSLPEPHRSRLLANNGGEVRAARQIWTLFPVWDSTNRKTMGRTAGHIVRENEAARRDWPDIFPDGVLAIADNSGGDYLVLQSESDSVFMWDHETGAITPVNVNWEPHKGRFGPGT